MLHWMRDKFSSGRQRFSRILNRPNDNDTELVSCNRSENPKMLVSENDIFSDDHIKLRIIGIEGDIWAIEAINVLPITNLIAMVLGHFYNPTDSSKIESNYTLISVSLKRELNPASTVQDEGLRNYDEILLVEKYISKAPDQDDNISESTLRENGSQSIPSEKQIYAATKHLQAKNKKCIPMPEDCSDNFQFEIRKVLITLIEASATVLSMMPNCKQIFQDISSRIDTKMEPDKTAIDKIMSLGFSEAQAIRALQMKRNKVNEAIEWLVENAEKVKEHQATESLPGPSRYKIHSDDPILIITNLLDYFRETRIKNFEPDDDILQDMVEMGFPPQDCIDALRITGNSKSSAYEWLIGERKMTFQDIDTGLDMEGPMYKALMINPTIQLGLHNPKVLLAFLGILENPTNANIWLNDSDTKPILNQVFKIYHSEKHVLLVNNHVQQYLSTS